MSEKHYYINKKNPNKEIIYLDYDKLKVLCNSELYESYKSDLEILKEHQIFTPNIDRLSRDIVNIVKINEVLEKNNSDIFLVYDDKYLSKDVYNKYTLNVVEKIMVGYDPLDIDMERDY